MTCAEQGLTRWWRRVPQRASVRGSNAPVAAPIAASRAPARAERGTRTSVALNTSTFAIALCVTAVTAELSAKPISHMPAECGSISEFWEEVERLVGDDVRRVRVAELIITDTGSDRYALRIRVDGELRVLEHSSCRTLLRSAVIIAAVSVRPELGARLEETRNPPAGAGTEAEPQPPPRPSAPEGHRDMSDWQARRRVSRWDVAVGGGAGALYGVVPDLGVQAEVYTATLAGRWGWSLAARYVLPRDETMEGRSVEISAAGGRASAMYAPTTELRISLGLEIDWMVGKGLLEVGSPRRDSAWSLAPCAELAVIPWNLSRMRLELAAQARVAVLRPHFVVTGFREVYTVPTVGAGALVRGVWHFF